MRKRWERALVTGASSGIGREIARQLADEGTDLVIVARDGGRLHELADQLPVDVEVLVADLADRTQLAEVERRVASDDDPIDLLVNNAGIGNGNAFGDIDIDAETAMIDINVTALQRLTHVGATAMVRRGRGTVLNVSSVAGFLPSSGTGTYGATKAFVTKLSNSMHSTLAGSGVTVTALCPGLTHTEFHERAGMSMDASPDQLWQDAEVVAAAGLDGAAAGTPTVVPGIHNKVAVGAMKVLPDRVQRFILGRVRD